MTPSSYRQLLGTWHVQTERASPLIKDEDGTENVTENVTLSRLFSFAKFVKRANVLRAESKFKVVFITSSLKRRLRTRPVVAWWRQRSVMHVQI